MNGYSSPNTSLPVESKNGELILVGMGLWDENGISLLGVKAASAAEEVYAELYTSVMPGLNIYSLEKTIGKKITILKRRDLEEDAGERILKAAQSKRVVLLVPGEPLAATTHVSLRLKASEVSINTHVIHAASILSAAPSFLGLQHYKFGKTVTIPIPQQGYLPVSPYDVVSENLSRGLHTLLLLDLDVELGRYLLINEALGLLLKMEDTRKMRVFTDDRIIVGLASIGSLRPVAKCGFISELAKFDFGPPPHTLVVPGELHFMEAKCLVNLFGAPSSILSRKSPVK